MRAQGPIDALLARRDALLPRLAEQPDDPALVDAWRVLREEIEAKRGEVAQRLVDRIRIAAPCPADWASMAGGERVRRCGSCDKNVYSLDGLSAVEVAALMREHEGSLCVRLFRRRDGTVLTADCAVGHRRRKRRLRVLSVAAATMAGLAAGAGFGVTAADDPKPAHLSDVTPPEDVVIVMGAMRSYRTPELDAQPSVDGFLRLSERPREFAPVPDPAVKPRAPRAGGASG
ncbi:MAG: hypothetical protein AB8I08_26020 [Sandaracinaceae bacterium]